VSAAQPLACPTCARRFGLDERFCPDDGMPLVYVGRGEEAPITEAHERARKIKPQYTSGDLVKIAWARNLSEAELMQGILLDQGIPSVQRRSRGFDVPDFLAAGPRDILVPLAAEADARELVAGDEPVVSTPESERGRALRLVAGLAVALVIAALIVWALYQLAG
jgi:hypothetical protein